MCIYHVLPDSLIILCSGLLYLKCFSDVPTTSKYNFYIPIQTVADSLEMNFYPSALAITSWILMEQKLRKPLLDSSSGISFGIHGIPVKKNKGGGGEERRKKERRRPWVQSLVHKVQYVVRSLRVSAGNSLFLFPRGQYHGFSWHLRLTSLARELVKVACRGG